MKDYYRILEVHPEASPEVLNKAFRVLVQKFHPDHYHLSNKQRMEEKMREINEAYDILSDPKRRKKYDSTYEDVLAGIYDQSVQEASSRQKRIGNVIKWFMITVAVLLFFSTGLRMMLAHPFVRLVLFVGLAFFLVRNFRRS